MKNPNTIFSHLYSNQPKFVYQRCFQRIMKLLPQRFQDHILYIYKKQGTLYFVLNHPGFVMEFNYNKKHINEVLKLAKKEYIYCQNLEFSQIKCYAKFRPPKQEQSQTSLQKYKERAKGEFAIEVKNEKLAEILLRIKESIKKNAAAQREN
ncbi:hypothetical protein [Nitratiruptor tergarcus]|uniref:DUF721 domain-containing protein n=1 Tax=Nitratiruptor tergarcus DSM 16512 TaxID=1069081 RepID=A0A1W1WWH5_9BACT|nr:hypothetical protein [Nitratiruptor tergarcus]SMC10093.1 hypothetical protein SAMN05660197_1932 [Nitratiruptor tergarcus DSM 16512]